MNAAYILSILLSFILFYVWLCLTAAKDNYFVLVHARMGQVAPVTIDLTVRTSSRALSQSAIDFLTQSLLA
jgi:hypothetical protein